MSEENVEIVRRGLEAAWQMPTPDFETLNELYRPDYQMESNWGVEGKVYRGAPGFREILADMNELWAEWRQEIEEVVDGGSDQVVVVARLIARGKSSGAPLDSRWSLVFHVTGGRIASTRSFTDPAEAFAAVGLPSPA
jgi:ketosteroid isomerase-like protein